MIKKGLFAYGHILTTEKQPNIQFKPILSVSNKLFSFVGILIRLDIKKAS